jgi:hypothetical protein
MKVNGDLVPDRMTHEEAADFFMSTAVGRSTGASRTQVLKLLRERFKTEDQLAEFIANAKRSLEAMMMPAASVTPARRFFEYTIGPGGDTITCNTCGMTSYNWNDIKQRYCGKCKKFHKG